MKAFLPITLLLVALVIAHRRVDRVARRPGHIGDDETFLAQHGVVAGPGVEDVAALTADTRKTVLPVVPKVVNAMQEAVAVKGVAGAIPVCKEQAPALIEEKRVETGWDIRRVSLKTRNAERGTPDLWEARQLADFDIRAGNGEKPETLEKSEVVTIDGKRVFRYMKALPVSDVCLNCHGPVDGLDAGLKAELGAKADSMVIKAESFQATDPTIDSQLVSLKGAGADTLMMFTGYDRGQIRGALTVKRPL